MRGRRRGGSGSQKNQEEKSREFDLGTWDCGSLIVHTHSDGRSAWSVQAVGAMRSWVTFTIAVPVVSGQASFRVLRSDQCLRAAAIALTGARAVYAGAARVSVAANAVEQGDRER